MSIELKSIVGLVDQICHAFKRGEDSEELTSRFQVVVPPCQLSSTLRSIDTIGMSSPTSRQSLHYCGIRLYNVVRALEPQTKALLEIRMFAVRCMEAGGTEKETVLLCYMRTGLKMKQLASQNLVSSQDALSCFRRGFNYETLADALMHLAPATPEEQANEEGKAEESQNRKRRRRSNATKGRNHTLLSQELDDYGRNIFEGAVAFTEMELEHFERFKDTRLFTLVCSMWNDALPVLRQSANEDYLEQGEQCARALARALYKAESEIPLALQLLSSIYKEKVASNPTEMEDLVLIAEMQVATGDRALAYATLEQVHLCRKETPLAFRKQTELLWTQLSAADDEAAVFRKEDDDKQQLIIQNLKESCVYLKLALAEVVAQQDTTHLQVDADSQHLYQTAVQDAQKVFERILLGAREAQALITQDDDSLGDKNKARTALVECLKLSCNEICNVFNKQADIETTVRNSFLRVPSTVTWLQPHEQTDILLEALCHLSPTDTLVSTILEGLSESAISPLQSRFLIDFVWRRLQAQRSLGDLDGLVATGEYLIEFAKTDQHLLACTNIIVAECILEKTKHAMDVDEAVRISRFTKCCALCKEALQFLQLRPDELCRAHVVLFQASLLTGNCGEGFDLLNSLITSPELQTQELCACARVALLTGNLSQTICIVSALCKDNNNLKWVHHLVSLRLLAAEISPTGLLFGDAPSASPENLVSAAQEIVQDLAHLTPLTRDGKDVVLSQTNTKWLQVCLYNISRGLQRALRKHQDVDSSWNTNMGLLVNGQVLLLVARLSLLRADTKQQVEEQHPDEDQDMADELSEEGFIRHVVSSGTASLCDFIVRRTLQDLNDFVAEPGLLPNCKESILHDTILKQAASTLKSFLLLSLSFATHINAISSFPGLLTLAQAITQVFHEDDENDDNDAFKQSSNHDDKEKSDGWGDLAQHEGSLKLAQIGFFFFLVQSRHASHCCFRAALQKEMSTHHPDGNLLGKILVLLIKTSKDENDAIHWTEQALQIQQASKPTPQDPPRTVFDSTARQFISNWTWNIAVGMVRKTDSQRATVKALLQRAIQVRRNCGTDQLEDSQRTAAELEEIVRRWDIEQKTEDTASSCFKLSAMPRKEEGETEEKEKEDAAGGSTNCDEDVEAVR